MDIGKSKDNFDKDRKPRCFNCTYMDIWQRSAKGQKEKETLESVISMTK